MASIKIFRRVALPVQQISRNCIRCFSGPLREHQMKQQTGGTPKTYKPAKTKDQPKADSFEDITESHTDSGFVKSEIGEITEDGEQRTVRIYYPTGNTGQQYNRDSYGWWKVEFVNAGRTWNNPLMGWTSREDQMYDNHFQWVDFETKEDAIKWAIKAGYKYEIQEPRIARKKPKNYNSTFGLNGIPKERPK